MSAAPDGPRVVVTRQGVAWRWTFVAPDGAGTEPLQLPASIAFLDPGEAAEAAAVAYPGVPVVVETPEPARRGSDRRNRRRSVLVLGTLVVALVVVGRRREGALRLQGAPDVQAPPVAASSPGSLPDTWRLVVAAWERGAARGRRHHEQRWE